MLKWRLGSALSGRSYWSRRRELTFMVLTHNIMILLPFELVRQIHVFYRAGRGSLIHSGGVFHGRPRAWSVDYRRNCFVVRSCHNASPNGVKKQKQRLFYHLYHYADY